MRVMLPAMQQLWPFPLASVDPADVYAADDRPVHPDGRPWVLVNMISSADGATAIEGRSGALGSASDKEVFAAIRAVADVILVAAGTVRAEEYGPPKGRARLAVVSRAVDLDPAARLFADAEPDRRPWLVTTSAASVPEALRPVLDDVIIAGDAVVDAGRAIAELAARGARCVLCEGGPSLNGQLVAAGMVDELCLTLAPMLASGDSARVAHGPPAAPLEALRLARVLEQDGYLFLRYAR
jgi:riboflavin biosynthesis pyrimidine reductase